MQLGIRIQEQLSSRNIALTSRTCANTSNESSMQPETRAPPLSDVVTDADLKYPTLEHRTK